MEKTFDLGFVGAGRMAGAIVSGLVGGGVFPPQRIACTCGDDDTGPELAARTGIAFVRDLEELVQSSDTILLACKPQQFSALGARVGEAATNTLVISILAGTTIERLATVFGSARCLVRTMPNTPGQVGAGITAWAARETPSPGDLARLESILGALGKVLPVTESDLDAITAVSGSGPAYVFEFTAALEAAAIASGLEPRIARVLARQTVIGSARLLEADPADPEDLRNRVTSPGGTTEAALRILGQHHFRDIITSAVLRARDRSIELAGS